MPFVRDGANSYTKHPGGMNVGLSHTCLNFTERVYESLSDEYSALNNSTNQYATPHDDRHAFFMCVAFLIRVDQLLATPGKTHMRLGKNAKGRATRNGLQRIKRNSTIRVDIPTILPEYTPFSERNREIRFRTPGSLLSNSHMKLPRWLLTARLNSSRLEQWSIYP